MGWKQSFLDNHATLSGEEAEQLNQPQHNLYPVEVRPPREADTPAVLDDFVQGVLEIQNKWLGLKNTSPTAAYEIIRPKPDTLRFQYVAPTKRLERKIRTQISDQIPGAGFQTGSIKLPVKPGDSIGGGILTTGREDWYTFKTEFTDPPINAVSAILHRHAMQDTKIVVQVLFKPIAAKSLKNRSWRRRAVKQRSYLRREKEKIWGSSKPTPREKRQAKAVDQKIGNARFWTSIRLAVIGAGEHTPSRVKELAGGFNRFENPETGQYLNASTVNSLRRTRFIDFYRSIHNRIFGGWSLKFRTTSQELAGLVSLPDRSQENIRYSTP